MRPGTELAAGYEVLPRHARQDKHVGSVAVGGALDGAGAAGSGFELLALLVLDPDVEVGFGIRGRNRELGKFAHMATAENVINARPSSSVRTRPSSSVMTCASQSRWRRQIPDRQTPAPGRAWACHTGRQVVIPSPARCLRHC